MKIVELYQSARMINSLYKKFLGRGVDIDGLRYHLQRFMTLGFSRGTTSTIDILMNSEEFQVRYRSRKRISFPSGDKRINGKHIQHVISLGNHCLTATILKKYGIKKYSTPFDWIFTSPALVADCLSDNFATLMNPAYHQSITLNRKNQDNEPGAAHLLYQERYGTYELFTHRDITTKHDFAYFSRAVERFRNVLSKDEGKIFIMVSRPKYPLAESFDTLVSLLKQQTTNFAFYAFQLIDPVENEVSANIKLVKNIDTSFLYALTPSFNEGFTGRFDNHPDEALIISLLSEYEIDI